MKKRSLLIFLVASLLLIAVLFASCDKPEDPPVNPPEDTPGDEPVDDTVLKLDQSFKLLRDDYSKDAVAAAIYIRTAVEEMYGFTLEFETDFISRGATVDPNEHVILVGKTNREASALVGDLKPNDYGYRIPDAKTIVIGGGNTDSVMECAVKFCEDMFGYTAPGTGEKKDLKIGTTYDFRYQYPVSKLSICGAPSDQFTILYAGDIKASADQLSEALGVLDGYTPAVKSGSKASTPHAIHFINTAGNASVVLDFSIYSENGDVYIDVSPSMADIAVEAFLKNFVADDAKGEYNIDVPETPFVGLTTDTDFNGLVFIKSTDTEIAPGVTYSKREYKNASDKPVIAHVVIAKPGSVRPVVGTPNAQDTVDGTKQIVIDQVTAAEAKYGFSVLAAVNGDLFGNHWGANTLDSINIRNGVALSTNNGNNVCYAYLKDGTSFTGSPDTLLGNLRSKYGSSTQLTDYVDQMVGGHMMIVENGHICYHDHGDPFSYTTHPRTAVGYREDGTIIMVVVDGRQPSISNGASLHDMGIIFRELGAFGAANFDGGGSSMLVTKNTSDNTHVIRNSPSDHDPYRPVVTTLFFVQNPDYKPEEGK